MRETHGREQHAMVRRRELGSKPLPECRGTFTQVHDNGEDRAGGTTNELRFAVWRALEVQSAYRSLVLRHRYAALRQFRREPVLRKFMCAPGAREKPALVALRFHVDQECTRERRGRENHGS